MRYVSLNAWGGQCWPALKDWLEALDADVICLQEVIRAPYAAPDWLQYVDPNRRLDQRANLFDDVSVTLPRHYGVFAPAARGPLQDAGGRVFQTEHGIALWVHRRHAVTALHNVFAYGQFRASGWGPEPIPRAMQLARVWSDTFKQEFALGHFHGLRHPAGKGDMPERREQTAQVARQIQSFRDPEIPCILAGDFNILPDNEFFGTMAHLGLQDQVIARGFTDTRTTLYPKPQRFANYLLTSPQVTVQHLDLPTQPEVSDHRPMILDFSL